MKCQALFSLKNKDEKVMCMQLHEMSKLIFAEK